MCSARRRGPRKASKISETNLDCAFIENAHNPLIVKSQQNRIELATRPGTARRRYWAREGRRGTSTTPPPSSLQLWKSAFASSSGTIPTFRLVLPV